MYHNFFHDLRPDNVTPEQELENREAGLHHTKAQPNEDTTDLELARSCQPSGPSMQCRSTQPSEAVLLHPETKPALDQRPKALRSELDELTKASLSELDELTKASLSERDELPKDLLSELDELPKAMLHHAEVKPDNNTTQPSEAVLLYTETKPGLDEMLKASPSHQFERPEACSSTLRQSLARTWPSSNLTKTPPSWTRSRTSTCTVRSEEITEENVATFVHSKFLLPVVNLSQVTAQKMFHRDSKSCLLAFLSLKSEPHEADVGVMKAIAVEFKGKKLQNIAKEGSSIDSDTEAMLVVLPGTQPQGSACHGLPTPCAVDRSQPASLLLPGTSSIALKISLHLQGRPPVYCR